MSEYTTIPQDAIADLDVRFSALAAEIAADDPGPEPEPPAGGAAVKRSKYDGLTGEERAQLYNCTLYTVELTGDGEWTVRHNNVSATFIVRRSGEKGIALVESNTGHLHRVNVKESSCGCHDSRKNSDYRDCKHITVCRAVVNSNRAKKAAEEAARQAIVEEKFERNRQRLAAYIEHERTSRRLAA
jgi:hypothetical protein